MTFTNKDKERVSELKRWSAASHRLNNSTRLLTQTKVLSEISGEEEDWLNAFVQVISVHPSNINPMHVFITVWDSSKTTCQTYNDTRKRGALQEPPMELRNLATNRTIDIQAYDNHAEKAMQLKPGQIVMVKCLHITLVDKNMLKGAGLQGFINETV